jgi:predicted dehydrogenase
MSIDVAVIGCGYWGQKLIRYFDAVESLNLVAVYDLLAERSEAIQQDYPQVTIRTNIESVMKDSTIDAIAIATPISTHYLLAKKGLLNDKHIFVEKPMAMRGEEVRELFDLSRDMGKVLMADDTCLYNGKILAIRELIDREEIGDIYYFDAVRVSLNELKPMERSTGFYPDASVVWDLAPRDVALMAYLVDSPPRKVSATGSSPIGYSSERLPVVAWCHVVFENGVSGHLHVSWIAPEEMKRMVVAGSKKMIVYDDLNVERPITLYGKGVEWFSPSLLDEPDYVQLREGEIQSIKWDDKDPLHVAVNHFRDCILEGREPLSSASFAHPVVTILEAAEQSISLDGEPIEIQTMSAVRG